VPALYAWQPGQRTNTLSRSAGGLLLVSALITGLLNFPSTCHCGAEIPHPHSLFLLAEHHHHHDGTIEDVDDEQGHVHGTVAPRPRELAARGPIAQAATPEGVAGEQISLAIEELAPAARSGVSERFVWPLHFPLAGTGEPPEPPPPRSPINFV